MPDPTDQITDWQAKTDAATEGPWAIWHDLDHQGFKTVGDAESYAEILRDGETEECNPTAHVYTDDDAEFIATARTAMPKLLAAVQAVRARHVKAYPLNGPDAACFHCADTYGKWVPWPCPTIQALEDALGGEQ